MVLQLVPAPCFAVSFDCAKGQSFREQAACSNGELGRLDDLLDTAYQEASRTLVDGQSLKATQKKWMADADRCADVDCIAKAYGARISELEGTEADSNNEAGDVVDQVAPSGGMDLAKGTDITRAVETSGVGDSLAAAKEDAIRQAVESVVSSYVSSDLVQENDAIIKDKVINYSAGFIEKMEVLSQATRADGLYEVKIKAAVTTEKLRRKLEEQNIHTRELESDSMFGEAVSKLDSVNAAYDLWGNLLTKFPAAALDAKVVGKPLLEPSFQGENSVTVKFAVQVTWNKDYAVEFRNLLSKTTSAGEQNEFGSCMGFRVDNRCHSFTNKAVARKVFLGVYQHITPIRVIAAIKSADGSTVKKLSSKCIGTPSSVGYVPAPGMDGHPREKLPANPFVYASVSSTGEDQANYDFVFLLDPGRTDEHVRNHTIVHEMYSDTVDPTSYKPVGEFSINLEAEVSKDDVLRFKAIDAYTEACDFDQPDFSYSAGRTR